MSGPRRKNLSEIMEELKSDYLAKFPEKIAILRKLTTQRDWPALENEYHKLKGSGRTYGFPEVTVVSEKLERLLASGTAHDPAFFEAALEVYEKMHQSHLRNESFDFEQDSFVRTLLALKLN